MSSRRPPAKANLPECAFVIPVFNHGARLAEVIRAVLDFGAPVFVVDDGSTDDSLAVAKSFSGVSVLQHDRNQGKGAALLTGFGAAARVARWAITIDADGQHEAGDTPGLLAGRPAGGRGIVVGRREGMAGKNVPWTSRFGRGFSNFWVRMSRGPKMTDSQSGFRVYPLPEVLALKTRSQRFQYEVEVLALAHWHRMPVVEVPVRVSYQSKEERVSHFRPFVDFWRNAFVFTRLIVMGLLFPRSLRARLSTRVTQ